MSFKKNFRILTVEQRELLEKQKQKYLYGRKEQLKIAMNISKGIETGDLELF